jgi:ABC-type branched-subunit amino acid transport system ATPase component/ABC-type branched-subunit amino acid transport system permease subunit
VIVSGLAAAVALGIVGLPALRVPGLTLAVTTLGLAVIAPDWLFHQKWLGADGGILDLSQHPVLARGLGRQGGYLSVYYFCLIVVALALAGLWSLRRSGPGRLVIAVRDNEDAAAAFGVTPATVKLAALSLAGFLAGVAGVMWTDASPGGLNAVTFTPDTSLPLLAIPVIGGIGSLPGAVVAAALFYGVAIWVSPHIHLFSGDASAATTLILNGLGLILVLHKYPNGIAGAVQNWWQRRLDVMAERVQEETPAEEGGGNLVADRIELAFGGLKVLNRASIEVRPGEIVGLIGPNGAGKTTLLNVISGRLRAGAGGVLIGGTDVSRLDPEMRAGYGLGRSFQDAHLFPGLTVLEAVQVAASNRHKVGLLSALFSAPWVRSAEADSREEAQAIVDRLGLSSWSGALTSQLSTGTRRICDLACQVAAHPRFLLLDEPTAGIAQREAEAFGPLLRRIRDELDCAILIVEHDMPLLMGLCDRIYAMELGRVIAEGTPEEIRANPAVIASYLGTDEVAITRSGKRRPARRTAPVKAAAASTNGSHKKPAPRSSRDSG